MSRIPGPWTIEENGTTIDIKAQNGFYVAEVATDCGYEIGKANAMICAAAPALLEACQKVLSLLEANGYELQSREILRATIRLAEGGDR